MSELATVREHAEREPRPEAARLPSGNGRRAADALERVRSRVDALDERIVALLAERARLARAEALVRRGRGEPVEDPGRDAEMVRNAARRARSLDLDEEPVRRIYWRVVELAQAARSG